MIKRNPYLQHTYDSFDQPVTSHRRTEHLRSERRIMDNLPARMRTPLFAALALLAAALAFAGILMATYPAQENSGMLPVITADNTPYKVAPEEPGGMDVPHQDSTVYGTIRSSQLEEKPPIENLLEAEQPVDTSQMMTAAPLAATADASATPPPMPDEMADAKAAMEAAAPPGTPIQEAGSPPAMPEITVTETRTVPQQVEKIPPALRAAAATQKSETAPAGTAPETLAYVRSVMEEAPAPTAEKAAPEAAKIEPAAGASAKAGAAITPGKYYVQVASIPGEAGAPKEWAKLQKTHSALAGLSYKLQRADVAGKGTFYRIQAGPMSKDSAKDLCDAIKAQKPGGCLVVQ